MTQKNRWLLFGAIALALAAVNFIIFRSQTSTQPRDGDPGPAHARSNQGQPPTDLPPNNPNLARNNRRNPPTAAPETPAPPAQAALPFNSNTGQAALPFANPNAAGLPSFGSNAGNLPAPAAPAALVPAFTGDPKATLHSYLHQITGDRIPTLQDWQKLADLKLPGENQWLGAPIGEGHFVMSMCLDLSNNLWVGTEGEGVYRFSPADGMWTQFVASKNPPPDGNPPIPASAVEVPIGDNYAYAVACDDQGRIWVGHLNHGISVFCNADVPSASGPAVSPATAIGGIWQSYEVVAGLSRPDSLNGPLGERIFHITVAPDFVAQGGNPGPVFHDSLTGKDSDITGSVWMCTSAGLSIYFPSTDTWSYLTRADGLPSEQANSIAFSQDGTVFVATQCDGIAIGSPKDGYKSWKQVARRYSDLNAELKAQNSEPRTQNLDALCDELPTTPTGTGLPCNLMNDILVTKDGTVYAATTAGLAWSTDEGESWQYLRGADYAEKVRLSLAGPSPSWTPQVGTILSEDYITILSENGAGQILTGHRSKTGDVLARDIRTVVSHTPTSYLNAFVEASAFVCRGTYRSGIAYTGFLVAKKGIPSSPMPAGATMPSNMELETFVKRLQISIDNAPSSRSPAALLTPDWSTQGAWLGRVGRYWMAHAAAISPYDLYWGTGAANVDYHVSQGIPGTVPHDSLRYWISPNHTSDQRSLELTTPYLQSRVEKGLTSPEMDRRQSEWDDHGEATSPSREGPNVFFSVMIPNGTYCLSLYSVYGYGRKNNEPNRDYIFSIREHPANESFYDNTRFNEWPEMARTRVVHHYGGVYSRFLVQGPRAITVRVDRNWSFNANLNGAFLDEISPFPTIYYNTAPLQTSSSSSVDGESQLCTDILSRILELSNKNTLVYSELLHQICINVARFSLSKDSRNTVFKQDTAATLWFCLAFAKSEQMQRETGLKTSRDIEKSLRWDGKSAGLTPATNADLISALHLTNGPVFMNIVPRDRKALP